MKKEGQLIRKCDICFEDHETKECAFNQESDFGKAMTDTQILRAAANVKNWRGWCNYVVHPET